MTLPCANKTETADRRRAGLTLIELLVVMAVLGITAAVATTTIDSGAEFQLDLAEIQLNDACDWARRLAVSQRSAHGVVFDTTNDRFAVVQEDGEEAVDPLTKREYIVSFRDPNQTEGIDLATVDFGSTGSVAVFGADGHIYETGTVVLACRGKSRMLVIDPVTGELGAP